MELLNQDVREATRTKFASELAGPVTIHFFTQEPSLLITSERLAGQECLFCRETRQLLTEVAGLSEQLILEVHDFKAEKTEADAMGVDKIPAAVITGPGGATGVRFYGIPSGYEYMSLVEAIVDASKGTTGLSEATKAALKELKKDVRIQVFVTPTCPYCTVAVRLAHQMALESPRVRAEMVEATEFPHLAQKYAVFGVPKTIMNETITLDGAAPEEVFLEHVRRAAGEGA
ncbi:MAG: thioredoxin family protein [Candidatus Aminicenantes bacterium]|nr:thioredoxin family protein [Candidatus Aminicenantes bacterium]